MKPVATAISCLLGCALTVGAGQTPLQSQVESSLDSGSSRAEIHDLIVKMTDNPVPVVAEIAQSDHESYARRTRAIYLLATFKTKRSGDILTEIAEHSSATLRCPALEALAELRSKDAIPTLIRKLDDRAVCMQKTLTDPPRQQEVYVSDEAVRLLEQVTGQSFLQERADGHRPTKPWKDWWAKQKRSAEPGL